VVAKVIHWFVTHDPAARLRKRGVDAIEYADGVPD